jgi:hypothetical protein
MTFERTRMRVAAFACAQDSACATSRSPMPRPQRRAHDEAADLGVARRFEQRHDRDVDPRHGREAEDGAKIASPGDDHSAAIRATSPPMRDSPALPPATRPPRHRSPALPAPSRHEVYLIKAEGRRQKAEASERNGISSSPSAFCLPPLRLKRKPSSYPSDRDRHHTLSNPCHLFLTLDSNNP